MADSTEGDTDVRYLGLLVSALIALIAGLVIHSFIVGVNVTDWWKGRSVTPVDHIVTSLGISRMCAELVNVLNVVIALFLRSQDAHVAAVIIATVYAFFIYTNFWLTSLLSIVLCLKISNFHTGLFLYLRGMIVHRTVYFIVASVLISAFNGLNPLFGFVKLTINGASNTSIPSQYTDHLYMYGTLNIIIGAFIPLFFYWISSVLLFSSLYHHTTKMKMSSNLSINLETYYSVMKFVFFTFIYNTLYLIGHLIVLVYYFFYFVNPEWLKIILEFLPALHSCYLIYRTAKLRSQMTKVLQDVIDLLLQRKSREIRENIELVAE